MTSAERPRRFPWRGLATRTDEPAAQAGVASRVVASAGVLVVAVAATFAIALLNSVWFDAVNGVVHATETVARGLLYSSWLLLIGGAVVIRNPGVFGLQVGDVGRHLVLIGTTVIGSVAGTVALLRLVGATPYSDASLFIEAVTTRPYRPPGAAPSPGPARARARTATTRSCPGRRPWPRRWSGAAGRCGR